MSLIAETAVSGTAYSFDMLFSYTVPERMQEKIACGCRVLVPFGRGNKRRIGVVMKLSEGNSSGLNHWYLWSMKSLLFRESCSRWHFTLERLLSAPTMTL